MTPKTLQAVDEMSLFFNTENRSNNDKVSNINSPSIGLPPTMLPGVEYDAVRLSVVDISINKDLGPQIFTTRNKLYLNVLNGGGFHESQLSVTFDKTRKYGWPEICAAVADSFKVGSAETESVEWITCSYDPLTALVTFGVAVQSGVAEWYYNIDFDHADSCHRLFGFDDDLYPVTPGWGKESKTFTAISPIPPGAAHPEATPTLVPDAIVSRIYDASFFLHSNLGSTNIDNMRSQQIDHSSILMRLVDLNVKPGTELYSVASYKNQYSTLAHCRTLPAMLHFWLTRADNSPASFENNWQATFNFEFLAYK